MDVTLLFLLIVLHFESHSCELCPGSDGGFVCCLGYVLSLKQRKCIPCMKGYTGVNCTTPCPVSYYGQNCISKCDCSSEHCHHVHGCRFTRSSTEDLHVQLSLSTSNDLMKNIYSGTTGTEYKERERATDALKIASSIFIVLEFILLAFYACSMLAPKRSCLKLLTIIRPFAENR